MRKGSIDPYSSPSNIATTLVRGPFHYSKHYDKNFIRSVNIHNFNNMQKRRRKFIPQNDLKKSTFKERFDGYLNKLKLEEENRGANIVKEMSTAIGTVLESVQDPLAMLSQPGLVLAGTMDV